MKFNFTILRNLMNKWGGVMETFTMS